VQPLPQAAARQQHGRFYNATSACSTARLRRGRCAQTLRFTRARRWWSRLALLAAPSTCSRSCRRASCRARTQGSFNISTRRAGHRLRRHGEAPEAGRGHRREGSERRRLHQQRGGGRAAAALNTGRSRRPEAARRAQATATRSSRSCGRSWRRSPACASSCRTRRRSASAAAGARAVPVHAAGHRHRGALRVAPILEQKMRELPGSRTSRATCRSRTRRSTVEIDRDKIAARSASRSTRSRRALQRLRHAQVSHDLRAEQPVPGDHAGRAAVPARSRGAVDALRARVERPADAARHVATVDRRRAARRSTTPASCRR
jgi:hypothetical protein